MKRYLLIIIILLGIFCSNIMVFAQENESEAYEITTEEQDGIERFILTATCTDDEFTNYMKTCYGADSEYRMTENGTTEEGDETLMYMKYGNEDSGRVIEFYLNVDENYLVTACKLVTFIE